MHVFFFFFRILKLFFITGFLLQCLGIWYRTSGPLVNFTIFISSVSCLSFLFFFLPCPPRPSLLLSLFSLSLGDEKNDRQGLTSLNPNTISRWGSSVYPRFCGENKKYICVYSYLGPEELRSVWWWFWDNFYFSIKTYVVVEMLLICTRNMFYAELDEITP